MEEYRNYYGQKKTESSDEVLINCGVENHVYHITKFKREVEKYAALKDIEKRIFPIDFLYVYYSDNSEMLAFIDKLRDDVANKTEDAKEAKRTLKDLDPSTEVKISIIIENLLNVCEKRGSGIGVINGNVYYYNGCYWELLEENLVKHYLSMVAEGSGLPHFQATKVNFIELLYKQLITASALPMPKCDTKEVKINLKNGTFKCSNGKIEFSPFSPDDRLIYQLPFEFNPNAKAEKFMCFLEEVIPEKEARMVVAEYIAYIFGKHLRWEKCLVLLGSGGNGKSVLIDIVTALLGEQNVCHFSLSKLCEANGYCRAEIGNYLLNTCSEMGSKNSDPEMVKQLFSNDPVSARSPYGKPITVSGYCRFLFSANFISNKDMEQTNGYFRRFLFLEFNAPIPEWKKNPNLAKEIIEEELSGVFNWVLEGLHRILEPGRQGFTYSKHIDSANKRIERNSNSVALFMSDENLQPSGKKYQDAKTLYSKYKIFCEDNHYGVVSKQEFLRRLETQLKYCIKRKATNNATWIFCEEIATQKEDKGENEFVEKFKKEGIINKRYL